MTDKIRCFWMEPTEQADVTLRRYERAEWDSETKRHRSTCTTAWGYHNVSTTPIERVHFPLSNGFTGDGTGKRDHADPRWPSHCACGYAFTEDDQWQVNTERLYRRADSTSDELYTIRTMPVGAMWHAFWYESWGGDSFKKGPDGTILMVMTPGGEWCVDGPANNGGGWTRTGSIPNVTARPSILIGTKYHGWLTDGYLISCG